MTLPHYILKILFAFLLIILLPNTIAVTFAAEKEVWSFAEHPHPKYEDFSERELDKLADVVGASDKCAKSIYYAYELYQQHYPQFSKYAALPDMMYQWQEHVMLQEHFALFCAYGIESEIILDFAGKPAAVTALSFCGQFSRQANSTSEKKPARAIDFLAHMAMQKEHHAAALLLSLNALLFDQTYLVYQPVISLNADVEYALKLFLKGRKRSTTYNDAKYIDIATPKSKLTHERIAFVEKAVQDGDLARVFDTTPPCTVR